MLLRVVLSVLVVNTLVSVVLRKCLNSEKLKKAISLPVTELRKSTNIYLGYFVVKACILNYII
jgi:hypothetical protein